MKQINKRVSQLSDTKLMLNEYHLCNSCMQRLFAAKLGSTSLKKLVTERPQKKLVKCYICKNFFSELDTYVKKILDASSGFEFSSFLVGAVLKPSVLDKDDQVRSKFQLKGIDSVKTDITRELGRRLRRKTKARVEFISPDVTFTVNFRKETYEVSAKPVFLAGRYTKSKRGIPQRQNSCEKCRGRGCNSCHFHGISSFDSVEGKIAKFLYWKFGSLQIKMTWIGGEDNSSLVLGNGRPFFVKLINPKKRKLKLVKKVLAAGITINNLKIIGSIPKRVIRFKSNIKLQISTEKEIQTSKLKRIRNLEKNLISIYENSGKENKKNVYVIKYKKRSKHSFTISMVADGGLPLKRFVEGRNVIPNISDIIDNHCKCEQFDFNNIIVR